MSYNPQPCIIQHQTFQHHQNWSLSRCATQSCFNCLRICEICCVHCLHRCFHQKRINWDYIHFFLFTHCLSSSVIRLKYPSIIIVFVYVLSTLYYWCFVCTTFIFSSHPWIYHFLKHSYPILRLPLTLLHQTQRVTPVFFPWIFF